LASVSRVGGRVYNEKPNVENTMKRKIIKQGHNAYTVTLPIDWIKRLNLKPKDEVDVLEDGNQIIINAKKNSEQNSISFDISKMPVQIIWKYFSIVYREGYDEIIVTFKNQYEKYDNAYSFSTPYSKDINLTNGRKTAFQTIQDIVNRFIGIEIIDFKENKCIIKQMEEPSDKQFENAVRRIFLLINQFFQDLITAIEKNDLRILQETHMTDTNVDRFHDFCCRVLNKTGNKSPHKSQIIFSTLYLLELLADEFKHISDYLLSKKKVLNRETILKFSKVMYEQFQLYEKLYNNFNHDLVIQIYITSMDQLKNHPKLLKQKNQETEVFYHLRKISEYIYSLTELRLEMEY